MKLIIGLGNPGKEYEHTRHNAGFSAVDFFIADCGLRIADLQNHFDSLVLDANIKGQKVILVKPQTFMNNSGKAVRELLQYYKLDPQRDLLLLHDDADLQLGTWKVTDNSSSAGHKGVQNIIDLLETQEFRRIRVGIDSRANRADTPTEEFVLQRFTKEEMSRLNDVFPPVAQHIRAFLET